MKILILGGHGFIGSHTSNILKSQGHEIAVVDCYHQYYTFPDWEYQPVLAQRKSLAFADHVYEGRIEDVLFMNKVFSEFLPDVVIHLATYPNAKMVHRNPADAANNMVTATANILMLCTNHKVKRIVFSSSSMVYGDFQNNTPDESTRCNPNTLYGSYKLQGERMVEIWSRDHGLEYVILRPSALYGTRDMVVRVISQMTVSALKTGKIKVQGPENKLDFSHVTDVARFFATVATTNSEVENKIFNCTRGRGRTILEAAEIVRDCLGFGEIEILPHDSFYPNRDTLDSSAITRFTGVQATVDIEQGIPEYINWLLAQPYVDNFKKSYIENQT